MSGIRTLQLALLSVVFLGASGHVAVAQDQSIKVYQNYDFQPGEKILFEDDFKADQDGEFPAHWKLEAGQAVINKLAGEQALFLIDGNYAKVTPRMKTASYLGAEFTLEFDFFYKSGGNSAVVLFTTPEDDERHIIVGDIAVSTAYFANDFSKEYTDSFAAGFDDKWHHIAIAMKGAQIKVYVDQIRALVIPDCECKFKTVALAGIASEDMPLIFKNIRLAEGGGMNMISKLNTDGKIVTHGILFDTGKATIKPQSMGVINEMVKMLKENAGVKLEIDGHTDTDGNAQINAKLSQDRADAVKALLVSLGIDGGRLTTKGFGPSKPIDVNTTPEGKANNRRVEFVKIG